VKKGIKEGPEEKRRNEIKCMKDWKENEK